MSSQAESSPSVAPTRLTKVFQGHSSSIESVAYFPDGRHIASGSRDKTIRIWNVESGKQQGEGLKHDAKVKAIAIAPDGMKIAGRVVGGLIVWDVVRRKRLREIKTDGDSEQSAYALIVAFSPDGRWIATASSASTSIQLWDVDTGSPVRELQQHVDVIWCLSFSPDGAHIATGSFKGSFQVLEISTGKTVVGPVQGHGGAVRSLVYSPDNRLLVTASADGNIRAWDPATGREMGGPMLQPKNVIRCISISTDGKRIASASSDRILRLWNLETRLQVGDSFAGRPSDWKHSVAFSPNGRFVVSGGTQDVYLWDTTVVLDSAASRPITGIRESSPSIGPSAPVTTYPSPPFLQQRRTPSKAHGDTSSLSSSILELPAAVQPQPDRAKESGRAPSIDWDSVQSHRRLATEPTETRPEPEQLDTPPFVSDSGYLWTRITHRWPNLRSIRPRAHVETLQGFPPKTEEHLSTSPAVTLGRRWLHTIHQNKSTKQIIEGQADIESLPTQKRPPMRFWNRLRGSGAPSVESRLRDQKQPTPGVVDVAGGRDKVRLIMSPDTERYGVPPPEPVELPPIASRPPSFFEIEEDPLEGWSWSRELRELICCYWCFPRNTRPV